MFRKLFTIATLALALPAFSQVKDVEMNLNQPDETVVAPTTAPKARMYEMSIINIPHLEAHKYLLKTRKEPNVSVYNRVVAQPLELFLAEDVSNTNQEDFKKAIQDFLKKEKSDPADDVGVANYLNQSLGTSANIKETLKKIGILKDGANKLDQFLAVVDFSRYLHAKEPKLFARVKIMSQMKAGDRIDLRRPNHLDEVYRATPDFDQKILNLFKKYLDKKE